jgi:hypothetical protein
MSFRTVVRPEESLIIQKFKISRPDFIGIRNDYHVIVFLTENWIEKNNIYSLR